jgi:exosortase
MSDNKNQTARPWWPWVVAAALLGLAFYPTLTWLVASWLGNSYYSHGFLVAPLALILAWRLERHAVMRPRADDKQSGTVGVSVAAIALGLHGFALTRQAYLVSAACLVVLLAGIVLAFAGWATLRRQAFPLGFLFLMIPLPWLETCTPGLARWMAATAVQVVRLLGLPAQALGARIELAGTTLAVGTPCSGVNSLAALVTLAALYAFLLCGPWSARLILVFLALPVALLANLVRICILLLLAFYIGTDFALGYFHDWSSPLLFLLALGLLVLLGKWLRCGGIRSDI